MVQVYTRNRKFVELDIKKSQLYKIFPNRDEKGHILTYSIYTELGDGSLMEWEANTRKELKCFTVPD